VKLREKWEILKWVFTRVDVSSLRKLTGTISKTHCTVFFINQEKKKLGYVWKSRNNNWRKCIEILCLSSFRYRSTQIKDGDVLGNRTKVKVNKVAPPFKKMLLTSCMVKEFQNRRDFRSCCRI
jgi:RecA/RadA recombinase